jgi:hypothetical protein
MIYGVKPKISLCFISYHAFDYVFSSFWFANSKAYGVTILSDSATDTKV